ncbi:MAG: hypothetical protein OEZ22_02750 [Spirochaetia bacterium]|nr:hypothetical protein [Spirochaetia bacterium]
MINIKKIDIFVVGFLVYFINTGFLFSKNCSTDFVINNKVLSQSFYKLKDISLKCKIEPKVFLSYGEKALLAKRPAEAFWSSQKGMWRLNEKSSEYLRHRLILLKGASLLELKRTEESIIELKKISLDYNSSYFSTDHKYLVEKAHMLLIKAYFEKSNEKITKDVLYLVNIFKEKFPMSKYEPLVSSWLSNNR